METPKITEWMDSDVKARMWQRIWGKVNEELFYDEYPEGLLTLETNKRYADLMNKTWKENKSVEEIEQELI